MRSYLPLETQELAERQAALCRIFSNPQRVLILWLLAEKERTVTEIALAIGASLQSASKHQRMMGLCNLVMSRREKHNIYDHIAENELVKNSQILVNKPDTRMIELEYETLRSQRTLPQGDTP
ncbi:MAG: ArsR family transcriptional regulator [Chloroflexota bacterium]